MTKRLVLVSGNIGAGKTSLTQKLGEKLGWRTGYESVADNPYLADFYEDMAAWAFHLQIFFLGHRAKEHIAAAKDPKSSILDRSIYEDYHIFAKAQYDVGGVEKRDFEAYGAVYELVVGNLPRPDLLIYLKCPVSVLMERIRARGRDIESGISAAYLNQLDELYEAWIAGFDLCPVLTIHTDDLDFIHRPKHLDIVVERIQDKLAGKEAVVFPKG